MNKDHIFNMLNDYGAELIGSRTLGVENSDSDYDFIVTEYEFKKLKKVLNFKPINGIIYVNGFFNPGYEIIADEVKIHVIVLSVSDWLIWNYTIQAIKTLPSYYYQRKSKRVLLFEGMVKLLKEVKEHDMERIDWSYIKNEYEKE